LNDRPTLKELIEVQEHFGLPSPALVEKDWYAVKALAAIAAIDTAPFDLTFGGGTALSRAHGLIKRMSEDIDLKIVASSKATRGNLRKLRTTITGALLGAGFAFDPTNAEHRLTMYEGRYTRYRLPYEAIAKGEGVLRPEIQIETSVWPRRKLSTEKPVRSFIAEGFDRPPEVAAIACSAIPETAAEKLVALTRRAGAELAGLQEERDPTLVRHIYDLHTIQNEYDAADVAAIAREVMHDEAKTRAQDFPAYAANPLAETLKAIDRIAGDAEFASNYVTFQRDMVYGGGGADFATAMGTLKVLAKHLKKPPASMAVPRWRKPL
jgi:predicted nucleotidyltransferase component of viral defense system